MSEDFNLPDVGAEFMEHPAAKAAGVQSIHVGAHGDEIAVQVVDREGRLFQGHITVPGWPGRLEKDRSGLIDWLASVLPLEHHSELQPEAEVLNLQYLFIRVMRDFKKLAGSSDDYDMLRIAGLLRLLMLDERPLAHQVNRHFRLPLQFEIGKHLPPNEPDPQTGSLIRVKRGLLLSMVGESFDPEGLPPERRTVLKWHAFLKTRVAQLTHDDFSVHEFIEHMAYIAGVVHADRPGDDKNRDLAFWRQMYELGGIPLGLITLRAIGRVVFRALLPLAEACADASEPDDENGS